MTSFGEYFDNQHAAIVKAMQDKNKQLNVEWMERYEKRQKEKQAYQIIEEIKEWKQQYIQAHRVLGVTE